METKTWSNLVLCLGLLAFITGCGVGMEPLMPTPVLYTECGVSPLDHIPENERWVQRRIYYATDRARNENQQEISFSNDTSDDVSVGMALIGFGGESMHWSDLNQASTSSTRDGTIELSVAGIVNGGTFPKDLPLEEVAGPDAAGWLLEDFNDAIDDARDKDVLVYVHGAKVNFYNACAFAAQLDHFMGRDMTSVAFSWPTRQDIFSYAFGSDRERAYDSASSLASLLEVLAADTNARRIHVLSWSAGARVATEAMVVLRQRYPDESDESLRERFRLGTVYFAAGDAPIREFLDALPTIHGISGRVVVTVSSDDVALKTASSMMGGGGRIGQFSDELTPEDESLLNSLDRLEIIDVSAGSETRGFDITGHRYWFDHPWASSDVIMAIRTDFPPDQRGLLQGDEPVIWSMPDDYPERLKEAVKNTDLRSD